MSDLLAGLPVGGIGWGAIASLTVLLVLRGQLVPGRTHRDQVAELTKTAEDWHAAYEQEREARTVQGGQLTQVLEGQKASLAVFDALRNELDRRRYETPVVIDRRRLTDGEADLS